MSRTPLDTAHLLGPVLLLPVLSVGLAAQAGVPAVEPLVAAAADGDRSGDVSAAEWRQFLSAVDADGDGAIDRRVFKARILITGIDADGDGVLSAAELQSSFASMDRDGDGALQAAELGGGGRRGGGARLGERIVARAADADDSGEVSGDEWRSFVAARERAGAQLTRVASWVGTAESSVSDDPAGLSLGVILLTLDGNLDADRDGVFAPGDLQAIFARLDRNGDGALAAEEMRPQVARGRGGRGRGRRGGRGGRRGGAGLGGWASPTAADRARPALVPFQRSLEDALALVRATGKPLLICVNIDAEPASEAIAWVHYRDPQFAALASGFVPVLASPDRHSPRDHDDRGRRIPDPKFGRLTDAEHIDIEPALFERYFNNQRVAPRHVGVDPGGRVLFDVYLVNDMSPVIRALETHGRPEVTIPGAAGLDEAGLLESPDAGHRERLEQRFTDGDEATRVRLTGSALSPSRPTQHPELVRLALHDGSPRVRAAALTAIARHPSPVPVDLFPRAFGLAAGDAGLAAVLLAALAERGAGVEDEMLLARIDRLQKVFTGILQPSEVVDLQAWRAALRGASPGVRALLAEDQLADLDRQLDDLERRRRAEAGNREVSLAIAELTMRYARIRMLANQDPTFLLEDVRSAASRATSPEDPDGRALGYLAWADHLLGDAENAGRYAAAAIGHLVDRAGTELAAEVLSAFALTRTQELYAAIGAGSDWPASWVSDIAAAYEVLLDHPLCIEPQVLAYADWLAVMELQGPEPEALRRAVARFPASNEVHLRYREQLLRQGGAQALETAYARLEPGEEHAAPITWYAGFASIVAAERQVQNRQPAEAIAAYSRSIDRFREAVRMNPAFQSSTAHYLALGLAGRGRLRTEAGELDRALEDLLGSVNANPASATWEDGLGNSPAESATALYRALSGAGRDEDARALRSLLSRHGVEIR